MNLLTRLISLLLAARTALRSLPRRKEIQLRAAAASEQQEAASAEQDPRRRTVPGNRRAENLTAASLLAASLCGFAFTVFYIVAGHNTQLLGLSLGLALAFLAGAAIIAGKAVVPQETAVEPRGPLLREQAAEEVVEMIEQGGEGISRRGLLAATGGLAGAGVATAVATPLASLGPNLKGIHESPWDRGVRLVDETGRPFAADSVQIGTFYTALPEGGDTESLGAGLLVVKLAPEQVHLPAERRDWAPENILAFSKICPHAGCAISLYRYALYAPTTQNEQPAFTCPCHYSTFSPGDGGRLIFGPAGRALPQLPLMLDAQRNLRAAGKFQEDIGPSWWNVHRSSS